jgi:hypothetical protein
MGRDYATVDRGSIPGRGSDRIFSVPQPVQTSSRAQTASYAVDIGGSFPGSKIGRGMNLSHHLHLVLRLRMREAVLLLSTVFMVWCLIRRDILHGLVPSQALPLPLTLPLKLFYKLLHEVL